MSIISRIRSVDFSRIHLSVGSIIDVSCRLGQVYHGSGRSTLASVGPITVSSVDPIMHISCQSSRGSFSSTPLSVDLFTDPPTFLDRVSEIPSLILLGNHIMDQVGWLLSSVRLYHPSIRSRYRRSVPSVIFRVYHIADHAGRSYYKVILLLIHLRSSIEFRRIHQETPRPSRHGSCRSTRSSVDPMKDASKCLDLTRSNLVPLCSQYWADPF